MLVREDGDTQSPLEGVMLVVRTRPDSVAGQRELRSSTTLSGLPLTPIQTSSNDVRLFVPYVRDCQPRVLCQTVGAGTTDGISATEVGADGLSLSLLQLVCFLVVHDPCSGRPCQNRAACTFAVDS